ncbi:hypothetical protein J6590_074871 [Homalodisca vitripennis]|nr:hypothetical protein J6590_074871 [Homalodisca vitripennis]
MSKKAVFPTFVWSSTFVNVYKDDIQVFKSSSFSGAQHLLGAVEKSVCVADTCGSVDSSRLKMRSSCRNVFSYLRIVTFPDLYIYEFSKSKSKNTDEIHTHNTRAGINLRQTPHRSALARNLPHNAGARFFSCLPRNIKNGPIETRFKSELKEFLIGGEFYSKECDPGITIAVRASAGLRAAAEATVSGLATTRDGAPLPWAVIIVSGPNTGIISGFTKSSWPGIQ